MNLSGSYIHLSKSSSPSGKAVEWYVPYEGENGISVEQQYRMPIKEAYEALGEMVENLTETVSTTAGKVLKGVEFLSDMFGIKIFTKLYYSQAWAGEEPATFSIKLKFFRGMNNAWDAKSEVFVPIMNIMSCTVPYDIGPILTAPGPNDIDCFALFAGSLVGMGLASGTVGKSLQTIGQDATAAQSKNQNGVAVKIGTTASNILFGGGMWKVEFGWASGGNGTRFNRYMGYTNLNCTQASYAFSSTLESSSYPISGDLNLTFKTQDILTSSDFTNLYRSK
jgi:hypothetical protein